MSKHPDVVIGQRAFEKLKPFFVKKCKDLNTYCCIYHVEIDELQLRLNNMRIKLGIHSSHARSMLKEYHFYINDDQTHDFAFVQHAFLLHWRHLTNNIGFLPLKPIGFGLMEAPHNSKAPNPSILLVNILK
jgi:hypothetical protein